MRETIRSDSPGLREALTEAGIINALTDKVRARTTEAMSGQPLVFRATRYSFDKTHEARNFSVAIDVGEVQTFISYGVSLDLKRVAENIELTQEQVDRLQLYMTQNLA